MRIKRRNLIDFGLRQLHFLRQGGKMRGGEMAVLILNQMQVLDQEVAAARPVGQQRLDFLECRRLDLAALWGAARASAAGITLAIAAEWRLVLNVHCFLAALVWSGSRLQTTPNVEWRDRN